MRTAIVVRDDEGTVSSGGRRDDIEHQERWREADGDEDESSFSFSTNGGGRNDIEHPRSRSQQTAEVMVMGTRMA